MYQFENLKFALHVRQNTSKNRQLYSVGFSKVFTTLLNFYLKDFKILARAFL